jgi:hypothetical protein
MKKLSVLLVLTAVLLLPQMALASTISTVGGYGPYFSGSGGEFTLLPSDDLGYLVNGYDASTRDYVQTGTFQSFCLEKLEYISKDSAYNAVINYKAINGGAGPQGDPISIGTAYLYHEFQSGTLVGYDYGTGRIASASLLQNAFWALEEEQGFDAGNPFESMVIAQYGSFADAKADNYWQIPVGVLNLTIPGAGLAQDMLVCSTAPVPEPVTLLLLGSGLLGLAGFRRKMKK